MTAPDIPITTTRDIAEHRRGRLGSYAWWQLRDYFVQKGIGTVLVSALLMFLTYQAFRDNQRAMGMFAEADSAALQFLLREVVQTFVMFGILFATNGIVAEDRKFGYYKFYFSKPVSATTFYAQKFAVHLVGFLLLGAALLGAFALVFAPILPPMYFPVLAMMFIGLGGVGFFLSAVTTADWVSLIGFYGISLATWSLFGDKPGLRGQLVRLLPPVNRMGEIYTAMIAREPLPTESVAWITAYGAAAFVLGLLVLARRRLATN